MNFQQFEIMIARLGGIPTPLEPYRKHPRRRVITHA